VQSPSSHALGTAAGILPPTTISARADQIDLRSLRCDPVSVPYYRQLLL
jgi:hypothetical protein